MEYRGAAHTNSSSDRSLTALREFPQGPCDHGAAAGRQKEQVYNAPVNQVYLFEAVSVPGIVGRQKER